MKLTSEASKNILIIGAGKWGWALASILALNNDINELIIYARNQKKVDAINQKKRHDLLGDNKLPNKVIAVSSLKDIPNKLDITCILTAIPAQVTYDFFNQNQDYIKMMEAPVIITSKGIDMQREAFLSELLQKIITNDILVLSGPGFAKDLIKNDSKIVTTIATNYKDGSLEREQISALFSHKFNIYYSEDIIATQLMGTMKNIIAIIMGVVKGLEFDFSTSVGILNKLILYIVDILDAFGLNGKEVILSPAGVGDIILTSSSLESRNMQFGYNLVKSKEIIYKEVIEGVASLKALLKMAERKQFNIKLFAKLNQYINNSITLEEFKKDILNI